MHAIHVNNECVQSAISMYNIFIEFHLYVLINHYSNSDVLEYTLWAKQLNKTSSLLIKFKRWFIFIAIDLNAQSHLRKKT